MLARFFTKHSLLSAATAAALLCCAASARADLVTNGGFETGDFTGWTTNINPVYDAVDTLAPHDGTYAAYFGNGSVSTISQDLATTAGTHYMLSFWLMNEADVTGASAPNSFAVLLDGATALSLNNELAFGYTEYNIFFDGTGGLVNLSFAASQTFAFWDLDSVSVNVPEPDGLALAGLAGILALGASRRRR
ncbi:PEP-CTERM sorting domain-containing protein [Paucibacter sp. R3-3]|uniref:PEP-CTERM sorting domain-containing protein n=1 Tax=Roseateles agri TaxID=3098619 RepID=A0ABU5DJN2_9BURK|nr:PEP-CTERM sorting domain-containing protein [Paucibacter sp. R3-3]MDY0745938.1 PEP-CTERM sorting domain-containing protein [Paucibacter sp. R3-3]